jgi:hypothetical protein
MQTKLVLPVIAILGIGGVLIFYWSSLRNPQSPMKNTNRDSTQRPCTTATKNIINVPIERAKDSIIPHHPPMQQNHVANGQARGGNFAPAVSGEQFSPSASKKQSSSSSVRDQLRERAKETFPSDTHMLELLGGAWDEAFIKTVGVHVLSPKTSLDQKSRLLDILAFWAHLNHDAPLGKLVLDQFDGVYRYATSRPTEKQACGLWAVAIQAVEEYGGVELFTEAFWKGYETGLPAVAFEKFAFASADILKRLELIKQRGVFPAGSAKEQGLEETIILFKAIRMCPEIQEERNRLNRLDKARKVLSEQCSGPRAP